MILQQQLTKKGIASFYVVAFSTLILLIIVISFATLVVSQLERSSNADLSQSAYDAALAGIEDAKIAYSNYKYCADGGSDMDCSKILEAVEDQKCDMLGVMLGRDWGENGVMVKESEESNNLQQAYTCVKIEVNLSDEINTVEPFEPTVYRPQFVNGSMNDIRSIVVEWGIEKLQTISAAIVQMPENSGQFDTMDFAIVDKDEDGNYYTNRGMVYLEPDPEKCRNENSCFSYRDKITARDVTKSNDKTVENKPFPVKCNDDSGKCSATIELPYPYGGGARSAFEVVISKPDGQSEEVSVRYCKQSDGCLENEAMKIRNQFAIDSTGRANDLFRRVKVRISLDDSVGVMGPLEVTRGISGIGLGTLLLGD